MRSISPEVSYRELIFEAAVKVYADAGIEPQDAGTFVSVTEDYTEGTAIADEYVPDQLGAVLKPARWLTSATSSRPGRTRRNDSCPSESGIIGQDRHSVLSIFYIGLRC